MDGLRVTARVLTRAVITTTAVCKAVGTCGRNLLGDHEPAAAGLRGAFCERQPAPGRRYHEGFSPTITIHGQGGTEY